MGTKINRRDFFIKGCQAGMTCCAVMFGSKLFAMGDLAKQMDKNEIPNLKELCYCSYKCPTDCKFLKATLEDNDELKKEAYDLWKIKERHGEEFDPDKMFCYGCKTKDKPEGFILQKCTVRECAINKEIDCCIECEELKDCNKDLWTRFPDFKKAVIEMQMKYLEAMKN